MKVTQHLAHLLPARFVSKIAFEEPSSCWRWTASTREGYGRYKLDGKMRSAHRVAYEIVRGPVHPGFVLDHVCANRACVNPSHLRQVSTKQNMEHRQGPTKSNSSGVRGVHWHTARQKWIVHIRHNWRDVYGGIFTSIAEAEAAAIALRAKLFTHDDYPTAKDH